LEDGCNSNISEDDNIDRVRATTIPTSTLRELRQELLEELVTNGVRKVEIYFRLPRNGMLWRFVPIHQLPSTSASSLSPYYA
jgi:hypothetical protein